MVAHYPFSCGKYLIHQKEVKQKVSLVTVMSLEVSTLRVCAYKFLKLSFDPEIHMPMQCVHFDLLERERNTPKRSLIFDVVDKIFISVPKVVSDIVSKFQGIYLVRHQEFGPRKWLINYGPKVVIKSTVGDNLNWNHERPFTACSRLSTDV